MIRNIIQTADDGSSCQKSDEQWTIDGMPQLIREAGASMGPGANVMVLACRWRYFAAEDLMGLKKLASNCDYRVVKMPCSGKVPAEWVSTALDSGADAVLIMGGHPSTCHFAQGTLEGDRMSSANLGLQQFDPARLLIDWSEGDEGYRSERFQGSVDQLMDAVGKYRGPGR